MLINIERNCWSESYQVEDIPQLSLEQLFEVIRLGLSNQVVHLNKRKAKFKNRISVIPKNRHGVRVNIYTNVCSSPFCEKTVKLTDMFNTIEVLVTNGGVKDDFS